MRMCLFCGGLSVTACNDGGGWWVSCDGCLARGPLAETRREAEEGWNGYMGAKRIGRPMHDPKG